MQNIKSLGLALALAAGLAFCNGTEAATRDSDPEMEAQLDFLSTQENIWKKEMCLEEAIGQGGKLAVTDLDNNGRLEILFTTTAGAEECIENWGYEVNEAGDGVSLLKFLNGSNSTDIGQSTIRMYFACQINERYYIFETARWVPSMEGGWAREATLSSLQLSQGQVRQKSLGGFFEAHESRELPPISTTYRGQNYNIIDAEAYAKLAKTHYNGCHSNEVTLGWVSLSELWKAKDSREKVRELFAKSWSGFHTEEIDEGPVH